MAKFKVITLCGSTKFKEEFLNIQKSLTKAGCVVLSVGFFSHTDNIPITKEQEEMLRAIHRQKIDMADEIFVINKNGYIGENTKCEIEYALNAGKTVRYLEPLT